MLSLFDPYRDFTILSVTMRIMFAVVCGSIIGIEREIKRRPAGLRTHILICLGAAITTMTGQYLSWTIHTVDPTRLGAQVIAGVGFIGAGTIVIGKHQRVKGLTTAAGLWTLAIIGLAIGAGFYEGAILATMLTFVVESVLANLELWLIRRSPEVNIMVEFGNEQCLQSMLQVFRNNKINLLHMEITRNALHENCKACVIFCLRLNKKWSLEQTINTIEAIKDVETAVKL